MAEFWKNTNLLMALLENAFSPWGNSRVRLFLSTRWCISPNHSWPSATRDIGKCINLCWEKVEPSNCLMGKRYIVKCHWIDFIVSDAWNTSAAPLVLYIMVLKNKKKNLAQLFYHFYYANDYWCFWTEVSSYLETVAKKLTQA